MVEFSDRPSSCYTGYQKNGGKVLFLKIGRWAYTGNKTKQGNQIPSEL